MMGTATRCFVGFGVLLLGGSSLPRTSLAQPVQPRPGPTLFTLDLSRTPVGELPANLELTTGLLEVALKNGVPMLKASAASEFRITLGQVLPPDFTVEFDLVPKLGSNPQDLSFEGTPTINQGVASAHLLWHATGYLSVIGGGGDTYEAPMPEDLKATLPGVLTHVVVEVQGSTLKLYTNGRRLYTLQKQFARGQVLRVFLGGQDGGTEAVYLAGLRITGGTGLGIIAAQAGLPATPPSGSTTFVPPVPGSPGGAQPQPITNNPLPVVNPAPPPQTASNQSGLTRGPGAGSIAVTVTMGTGGPLVSWSAIAGATGYTVTRSKSDDLNCCNSSSGRTWGATSPWQDAALPMPGTYVYTVIANTRQGQVQGQTSFDFGVTPGMPQVSPPLAANAGVPSSSFAVTVTMGANGPVVSWPAIPNATAYAVGRWKTDDANCCNNSSGRGWGAASPWQDQPLPMSGTYEYRVLALTPAGTLTAQTQFGFRMPGGAATPVPATALPAAQPTGTITPMPAPPPASQPAPGGSTVLTPTRPTGVSTSQPAPGMAPSSVQVGGTSTTATVQWGRPQFANFSSTITYQVSRAVSGTASFTMVTSTPITAEFFDDVLPNHLVTYTYKVTAIHPDGTQASATADYTPPPPRDPTNVVAVVKGPDAVELSWEVSGATGEYFVAGPGTGNGVTVQGTPVLVPVHPHRRSYLITGLSAGTHRWTVASSYQPGGVLTAAAQWPSATVTLATGKYEISIESVKALGAAVDDIFHGDGLHNEFYVTGFVRTKDQAGNVVSEASHRSPQYGDIGIIGPPARVKAGSASANGGVMSGDFISPIWDTPSPGAAGWARMVLWSGTLTAGFETVEIAPAVWEADAPGFAPGGTAAGAPLTYDDLLRRVGYSILDLNTRTTYGDISNVMLAAEGTGRFIWFHIMTEEDRPIGIAKDKDPFNDAAAWYPLAIQVDQKVAEAALSGAYGPPGLIPIQFVDHKTLSRDPITHPDLGMGNYTLNIRIQRLP